MAIATEYSERVGDVELARVRVSHPDNPSADVVEWDAFCEVCDEFLAAGVSEPAARAAAAGHAHVPRVEVVGS